jgi:predicted acylesterase/phospholipase RssA
MGITHPSDNNNAQSAIVFQGGGALGAYEAGAFDVLYYWIKKDYTQKNGNIFDIVAGTSIGAINAAILVSYVKENGKWEGSTQRLLDFWSHVSSSPDLSKWVFTWFGWPLTWDEKTWVNAWNQRHKINRDVATGEAARRYYSAKEFLLSGAPNFFSKPMPNYDNRFFDDLNNMWYKYDNRPLKDSISKFVTAFPIATSYDDIDKEHHPPRLLLVSVDVKTGTTVTFDSYPSKDEIGKEIRKYTYEDPDKNWNFELNYDKGIMMEHIIASASVPVNFDYALIPTTYDYSSNSNYCSKASYNYNSGDEHVVNSNIDNKSEQVRYFWDGGILSNSPLREVISQHKLFWEAKEGLKSKKITSDTWNQFSRQSDLAIPDLKVYIIDLWPSKEDNIPTDHDDANDRKNDITYQDRTDYDQKVAVFVSDYIDLIRQIGDVAISSINALKDSTIKANLKKQFDAILSTNAKSTKRDGGARTYEDLIKGRFNLDTTFYLERQDDPDTISSKWFDLSAHTITNLIEDGRIQALRKLLQKEGSSICSQLNLFMNGIKNSLQNQEITQSHADELKSIVNIVKKENRCS